MKALANKIADGARKVTDSHAGRRRRRGAHNVAARTPHRESRLNALIALDTSNYTALVRFRKRRSRQTNSPLRVFGSSSRDDASYITVGSKGRRRFVADELLSPLLAAPRPERLLFKSLDRNLLNVLRARLTKIFEIKRTDRNEKKPGACAVRRNAL